MIGVPMEPEVPSVERIDVILRKQHQSDRRPRTSAEAARGSQPNVSMAQERRRHRRTAVHHRLQRRVRMLRPGSARIAPINGTAPGDAAVLQPPQHGLGVELRGSAMQPPATA
jgi:hypothetical protein